MQKKQSETAVYIEFDTAFFGKRRGCVYRNIKKPVCKKKWPENCWRFQWQTEKEAGAEFRTRFHAEEPGQCFSRRRTKTPPLSRLLCGGLQPEMRRQPPPETMSNQNRSRLHGNNRLPIEAKGCTVKNAVLSNKLHDAMGAALESEPMESQRSKISEAARFLYASRICDFVRLLRWTSCDHIRANSWRDF